MEGGIGSPVSSAVVTQIEKRQALMGVTNNRSDSTLMYLTSKTGWVKLSSGVNTITQAESDKLRIQEGRLEIKGSSAAASSNILQGGLLASNGGLRQGIDTSGGYNQTAAYNNRKESTGIRPMPGITSMTVKSKNTFGTLREAEVKFSCWTLEDFELMEKLYLRPGFTMLLEWGHSLYANNNGTLIRTIETISEDFFSNGVSMTGVLKEIGKIRQNSNYNYEGMIGYCKNFSWNYLPNGGYECSVSIISTGEILESLALRFDPQLRVDPADFEDADTETGKEERKSVFHFFISKMDEIATEKFGVAELAGKAPSLASKLQPFTAYFLAVEIERWGYDKDQPLTWIPLRTVLDVFNTSVTLVDGTKEEGSSDRAYAKFNIDYSKSSKFLTNEEHFSVDPIVCVLPNKDINNYAVVNIIHDNTDPLPEGSTSDDVLNILVTTSYLKSILDAALDADGKLGKSMSDIVGSILEGINTALGGINDLGVTYDEEDEGGTWYIVDRNNTPAESVQQLPIFTLAGVDSIFTDVSISSKISNEIGSQIAIAAQGSTQNYSENVDNILKWNPGVVDRLRTTKDTSSKNKDGVQAVADDRADREEKWVDALLDFFTDFNGSGYNTDDMQTAKTMHAEWTLEHVVKNSRAQKGQPVPGIVPVELSFKMDGIGGFKIGESFRIASGILPSKYQDKFGYIITGLEHSIGTNQRWETSVTTQFILVEGPTAGEAAASVVRGAGEGGSGRERRTNNNLNPEKPGDNPAGLDQLNNSPSSTSTPKLRKAVQDQSVYAFTKLEARGFIGERPGLCAGFSFNIAYKLKKHLDTSSTKAIPWTYAGSGHAYQEAHRTTIAALGLYDRIDLGKFSGATLKSSKSFLKTTSWNYGDLVNYYNGSNFHTQIYTGDIFKTGMNAKKKKNACGNSGWTTSTATNYGASFVYGDNSSMYNVTVFKVKKAYLV
jgi:hypothetical protein